jgi:hypothetical protein
MPGLFCVYVFSPHLAHRDNLLKADDWLRKDLATASNPFLFIANMSRCYCIIAILVVVIKKNTPATSVQTASVRICSKGVMAEGFLN